MRTLRLRFSLRPGVLLAAFLPLLALATAPPAGAACDPGTWFGPLIPIPVAGMPNRVVLADLDGDGALDIAATLLDSSPGAYGSKVSIQFGDGSGGFLAPLYLSTGVRPAAVTVADFDGDGHPDLAVSNWYSGTLTILRGAGGRVFFAPVSIPCGSHPYELVAADFDEDGTTDLAVASNAESTIYVLRGQGGGTFAPPLRLALPDVGLGVATADFDGDGHADLVATAYQSGCVVFLGHGDGTFEPGTPLATGPLAYSVAVGDVDVDGVPDLAVCNSSYAGVAILKGNGSGGFGSPAFYGSGEVNAGGAAIEDFDGDGVPDLAVTSSTGNAVKLYRGLSSGGTPLGSFTPYASLPAGIFPVGIASGPCDGDAVPDLVVTAYTGGKLGLFMSTCPAAPPPPELPHLVSVRDVPNDEGGQVLLRWTRSSLDSAVASPVTGYRVWRRLPPEAAALALARAGAASPAEARVIARPSWPTATTIDYWEWIGEIPAQRLAGYGFTAPTLFDSTRAGNPYTAFFVTALTANPAVYFASNVDSGYSVDNKPPPPPSSLAGAVLAPGVALTWARSDVGDVAGYRVYRGDSPSFEPDSTNLVASVPDTGWVDAGSAGGCYKVSAVDAHGNEGGFAALSLSDLTGAPDPAAARLWLAPPGPNPTAGGARLRFSLSRAGLARLSVYDLQGRRVRELAGGTLDAGEHAVEWDGRDRSGGLVRAGLYVIALDAEGRTLRARVVVTR